MSTIIWGVALFIAIVIVLVTLILIAKRFMVNSGDVTIGINGDPEKSIKVPAGDKLLNSLSSQGIFIPSACGGGGGGGDVDVELRQQCFGTDRFAGLDVLFDNGR